MADCLRFLTIAGLILSGFCLVPSGHAERRPADTACVARLGLSGDAFAVVSDVTPGQGLPDNEPWVGKRPMVRADGTTQVSVVDWANGETWQFDMDAWFVDHRRRSTSPLLNVVVIGPEDVIEISHPQTGEASQWISRRDGPRDCCPFNGHDAVDYADFNGVVPLGGVERQFGRFSGLLLNSTPSTHVGVLDAEAETARVHRVPDYTSVFFVGSDGHVEAVAGALEGPRTISLSDGSGGWKEIAEPMGAIDLGVYRGEPETGQDDRVVIVVANGLNAFQIELYNIAAGALEPLGSVYEPAAGWGIDRSTGALVWVETMAGVLSPPEPFPADRRLLRALNEMVSEGYHTFHLLDRAPNGATLIAVDGAPHDAGPARYFLLRPEAERFESACAILHAALAREPGE